MINKRGGIVAIEPSTGEILALVTAPSYDPGILVGRQRSKNYTELYRDSIAKPLYDRGLLAEYPPGSPFKILTGLVALQEGVIDENSTVFCNRGFSYARGRFMGCHCHGGALQLHRGIFESCNSYFATAYMKTINKYLKPAQAVDIWSKHVKSFGLGQFMGYDLPTGKKGKVPDSKTYKRIYPNGGWRSTTIVSNSIGQGEVLMTPIQLANMMATVANEGYYYTPHIIKKIEGHKIDKKFTTKHETTIDKKHFKPIISGLFDVYNLGTARSLRVEGIDICGKTGTAENFAKIGGVRVKMEDHSIFVAFAPKDNPKIAGDVFTNDIVYYMRTQHNLFVGESTAEKIKIQIGAAIEDLETPPEDMSVQGRDLLTGKPKQVEVSYREIAKALDKSIQRIEDAVMETLSQTPPELAADIYNTGIYLAGGGSMLRGLDKRISQKTDLPVYIAEDPLRAVVRGTGMALKNITKFKSILIK